MKQYTIEMWVPLDACWQLVLGVPQRFESRAAAESRLKFESGGGRRCRLVNGKGVTVMHAGVLFVPLQGGFLR